MSTEAAKAFVGRIERYMGVPQSGGTAIIESAAKGLIGLLEKVHAKHPDLVRDYGASPYLFDKKSYDFLVRAVERETKDGKTPPPDLAVAFNAVKYIERGELADGTSFVRPAVAAPWTQPKQSDMFFNVAVYNELGIDLTPHDRRNVRGGQNWVSHATLFHPPNADPAQQKMIEQVAKDLKIEGRRLKIASDGSKIEHADNDPNAMMYYSRETIARMSTEILARQARAVCNIGEKDVTKAIMSGQYMPHLLDLKLAEEGFPKPPWDPNRIAELKRTGIIKTENPRPEDDFWRTPAISIHQSKLWEQRFGSLDQKSVNDIVAMKGKWAEETHRSPYSYYQLVLSHGRSKIYEETRENTYLPRLNWRLHNGFDLCKIESSLGNTAPSASSAGSAANTGPSASAAATSSGGGFVPSRPKTDATPSGSSAGNGAAAGCANDVFVCAPKDKVRDNARDTTGQTGSTPTDCGSDIFVCKAPAGSPPKPK